MTAHSNGGGTGRVRDPRAQASQVVEGLRREAPAAMRPGGVDIGPAVEQLLFHALRSSEPISAPRRRLAIARRAVAVVDAIRPGASIAACDILVVLLAAVHARLFEPVARELLERSPTLRIGRVTAGRASRDAALRALPSIAGQPGWRDASRFGTSAVGGRALEAATEEWPDLLGAGPAASLRDVAADGIARLGVEAIRLASTVDRARPRVLVTYDEIDAWSRLLAVVGADRHIPVVDLPHAEAVDVDAIRGVGYAAMGVFGPRAAAILEAAGVPRDRVAIVGASRFDPLVRTAASAVDQPPRVLFAAQYRGAAMTDALRAAILEAAAAATEAVGGRLSLLPHPTEQPASWDAAIAGLPAAQRATVRIERDVGLHESLPGAALLVTGWSNSVYEAVLAGVPAVTVHAGPGEPPMPFAREGIATEVRTALQAAQLAPKLLAEPARSSSLATARQALADHLGPLDGRATQRTADLVARFLQD